MEVGMKLNNVVLHHEGYVISIADHEPTKVFGTKEIAIWKKDERSRDPKKRVGDMEIVARFVDTLESFEAALTLAKDRIHELVGGCG